MTSLICNAYLTEDEMYDLLSKGYEIHLVVNYPHFRDDTHEVLEEIVINREYKERETDEEYDFWEHCRIKYKTPITLNDLDENTHYDFQDAMAEGNQFKVVLNTPFKDSWETYDSIINKKHYSKQDVENVYTEASNLMGMGNAFINFKEYMIKNYPELSD